EHVQPTEHDLRAPLPVPPRERVRALREREVHRDADDFGERVERRRALEKILVPITQLPARRRGRGRSGQRKARREHVLAEARVRVLAIERIDQERIAAPTRTRTRVRIELRRDAHLFRQPALPAARWAQRVVQGSIERFGHTRYPGRRTAPTRRTDNGVMVASTLVSVKFFLTQSTCLP